MNPEKKKDTEDTNSSFESRWRDRFTRFAMNHKDDAGIAGWSSTGLAARIRHFKRLWPGDQPQTFWLDVGCGAGTYSRLLASSGLNVLGFDYSLPTIQKARERSGNHIHWAVGDVKQLPIASCSVDGVLCFGVTQALSESREAIIELTSVIKPNGQLWVDGLNAWCLPHIWGRLARALQGKPPHLRYESPRQIKRLFRSAGLLDVRLFWLPILPARLNYFQKLFETAFIYHLFLWLPPLGALLSHSFVVCGRRPAGVNKQ
ncbi:MAG: class I SAM-dependent methyltransferase [Gammaproteobacteria bacterium]|nr:class I SAM-dependent methyltransferase [Gammaproteobacteria bacterium]